MPAAKKSSTKKPIAKKTVKKTVTKKTPAKKTTTKKVTAAQKISNTSAKIEKQFDEAMHDTQAMLKKNVWKKTKKTVKAVTKKAEAFANTVEHFWEEIEHVTDWFFPSKSWSKAYFAAEYSQKVSRLFIFRFLWILLEGPIIAVWSIRIAVITVIHIVLMFLNGKRSQVLRTKQQRYWNHVVSWKSYMNAHTDARPEIIGQ